MNDNISHEPDTLDDYQHMAHATSNYKDGALKLIAFSEPGDIQHTLAALAIYAGLTEEVAEVGRMMNRAVRDGELVNRGKLERELGDVLWFVAEMATHYSLSLDDIATANINKLRDRQARNVLHGEGDER